MCTPVLTASVEPTCCEIVPPWLSRTSSPGRRRCIPSCLICTQPPPSGEPGKLLPLPPSSAMNGEPAILRSWMPCCTELIRCSLCSMTSRSLLPTIRRSAIFGWRKFSKRLLAPFAVRRGLLPFVASAVIFLPCTSRVRPCSLLLPLSFMVNLYRSLGDLSSYEKDDSHSDLASHQ